MTDEPIDYGEEKQKYEAAVSTAADFEVRKKTRKSVLPPDDISDIEDKKGIEILDKTRGVTYSYVEGIQPDPILATRKTTIITNYITEKIPRPSINNITFLGSSSINFNKPKLILNTETDVATYVTSEDNYINASGGYTNLKIGGDKNTNYTIVVKDITNTKWYNWEKEEFQNGYNEKSGKCGDDDLILNIPPQTAETTYNIFFKKSGSTIYEDVLPTETNPWVITQLTNVTTTFKFADDKGFVSDQTTTKTHLPETILNAGSTNDGEIPITITVLPTRSTISLKNSTVQTGDITTNVETVDITTNDNNTEIINSDLVASVSADGKTGTITGTITLGKSARRDTSITFEPSLFFTIT